MTIKNKYHQGYFAGIKYARAKFAEEGKQETSRVRWVCAFWVVVTALVSSFIY